MIGKFIDWVCWKVVRSLPTRSRVVDIDGEPYLLRFYIKRNGWLPGIYLHHFYMGDSDRDLHDHPWKLSGSLILTGGYIEERLMKSGPYNVVARRKLGPGSINIIRGNDFHRVDLVEDRAWTIFVSGRKTKDWGFLIHETGEIINHRVYLANKGRIPDSELSNCGFFQEG